MRYSSSFRLESFFQTGKNILAPVLKRWGFIPNVQQNVEKVVRGSGKPLSQPPRSIVAQTIKDLRDHSLHRSTGNTSNRPIGQDKTNKESHHGAGGGVISGTEFVPTVANYPDRCVLTMNDSHHDGNTIIQGCDGGDFSEGDAQRSTPRQSTNVSVGGKQDLWPDTLPAGDTVDVPQRWAATKSFRDEEDTSPGALNELETVVHNLLGRPRERTKAALMNNEFSPEMIERITCRDSSERLFELTFHSDGTDPMDIPILDNLPHKVYISKDGNFYAVPLELSISCFSRYGFYVRRNNSNEWKEQNFLIERVSGSLHSDFGLLPF